jgi:hypothetical protein
MDFYTCGPKGFRATNIVDSNGLDAAPDAQKMPKPYSPALREKESDKTVEAAKLSLGLQHAPIFSAETGRLIR